MGTLSIKNENMLVEVNFLGAQLSKVQCNGEEYLWQGDSKYWSGQAPLLFPAIGSYENNQIQIRGRLCEMSNHGFLQTMNFEVEELQESKVVLLAKYNEETLQQYPFRFQVQVTMEVQEKSFISTYKIKNLDDETMVYNFGLHPALNCNIEASEKFEDYYVEFEKQVDIDSLLFNDALRIEINQVRRIQENTAKLELQHDLFHRTIIMNDIDFNTVWLGHREKGRKVELHFEGFNLFAMWQPVGSPFICLEPWNGIDGIVQDFPSLEESPTVQSLKVGKEKSYTLSWNILV